MQPNTDIKPLTGFTGTELSTFLESQERGLDYYIQNKDVVGAYGKPVTYVANDEPQPVVTLEMKRAAYGGGFVTVCVSMIYAAQQGAFVLAAQWAGIGLAVVAVLSLAVYAIRAAFVVPVDYRGGSGGPSVEVRVEVNVNANNNSK